MQVSRLRIESQMLGNSDTKRVVTEVENDGGITMKSGGIWGTNTPRQEQN